jgi:CheY-like chemotaxis protein
MRTARDLEFELPDDLVIGGANEDDSDRLGAGSTLPQDLFPLGTPSPAAAQARPAEPSPASRANETFSDTLPAHLVPAYTPVRTAPYTPSTPSFAPRPTPASSPAAPQRPAATVIAAALSKHGRLPHDGPMAKRVLVVDDDLTMRLYMRSRLMLRGHVQLLEAASGEEALSLVRQYSFDAILLDVDMGSQNGYDTCRAVRSHVRSQAGKQPRIYIITSRSSVIDKMRAKMAGADAFLSKPPHPGELAALLGRL